MKFILPDFDNLTPQMKNLVNFPINENLLVVWAPWTWKSVIAIHRYKKLVSENKKVLILCYNVLLSELLKGTIGENAKTIDSFYGTVSSSVNWRSEEVWRYISDESIDIIRENFHKYILKVWKYDAIIVDEAQDLSIDVIESLKILTNHITLLADPNQPLKNPSSDIWEIEYLFQNIHQETLERNYRNTKQIYEFAARQFMNWNELANNINLTLKSEDDPSSEPIPAEWIDTIEKKIDLIKDYVASNPNKSIGIFVSDIAIIENIYEELKKLWYDVMQYHGKNKNKNIDRNIIITTYLPAKWLEFDVVIIIINGPKDKNQEKLNNKLYVLSTRAKKKLYFIFS